jgi:glycosyltransferase involved in cell wall biosynthesis
MIMLSDNILVSICCIAYNQEKYIREAIDGFVKQKTNFRTEIIIHDDASMDKTADIIREYVKQYPELIVPIYQTENQYSKGSEILSNFVFPKVRGKYIAICEGDDYWTDPYKLQKQINFLEANSEFVGAAHQSWVMYEDNQKKQHIFCQEVKQILYLRDLLAGRVFHTASFVYRAKITNDNEMPLNITSGDRALFLLCATYGPIKYFNEPMCVYRKSAIGISSWVTYDMLIKDLNIVPWIKSIYPTFPKFQYLAFIHKTIVTYPKKVPLRVKIKHWSLFLLYSFSYFPRNIFEILRFIIHR